MGPGGDKLRHRLAAARPVPPQGDVAVQQAVRVLVAGEEVADRSDQPLVVAHGNQVLYVNNPNPTSRAMVTLTRSV